MYRYKCSVKFGLNKNSMEVVEKVKIDETNRKWV